MIEWEDELEVNKKWAQAKAYVGTLCKKRNKYNTTRP